MTTETIHTCSYECERPECIRAQRDELAARLTAAMSQAAEAQADEVVCLECGQPTMHMGQVCYSCSHPAAKPAEAQPAEARGAVDEGSRSVTRQLLHWGGVPVHVTGTVTTSPSNWALIDDLSTKHQGDK